MTTREETRQYRTNDIRGLAQFAANGHEPTAQQMETANELYGRIVRLGLAEGNFWESETEQNANSSYRARKENALYARARKLSNDIEQFTGGRAKLHGPSMFYVAVITPGGEVIARAHYFDY